MSSAELDCRKITDWKSFHREFSEVMGFPDFYGNNMNAWIDCMSSLGEPGDGMTKVHAPSGGVFVLKLLNVEVLKKEFPEQYLAILECSAFVNYRLLERGESAVLAISFWK